MKDVSSREFAQAIKKGKVIVDFWAPWCGPCKMLSPLVESLSLENADISFLKVNVDQEPRLASEFDVRSIPTLVFFREGVVVDQHSGLIDKGSLVRKLKAVFP